MKLKVTVFVLLLSMLASLVPITAVAAEVSGEIISAEGWFESASVYWSQIGAADGYNVYVREAADSEWAKLDSPLVRAYGDGFRADAVGLSAGEYIMKVVPTVDGAEQSGVLITDTLKVMAYDRSGYAHFNYTDGVGAYNDDGTLKDNAIVLYVTEENKNTVSITSKDGTTVSGIGNILNSVGQSVYGGKTSSGGIANTNQDIIRKLALDGTPLVVRIIGRVTAPDGLTAFDSVNYGGSVGDNGFMARMSGGKDVTIEGIGADAVVDGWGIHFMCNASDYSNGIGRSFEVRNLAFRNVPEDCVGMEGVRSGTNLNGPVERCWVHHCSFYAPTIANPAESDKDGGDGACDFKRGQYFTNSYCYYEGYHKTNLVGAGDSDMQYHITYHHNYWKSCESRGPLARQANIHMYNNIFEGQTSYCMNPRAEAYIFSEYNLFDGCKNPVTVKAGAVKSYGDSFVNCTKDNDATIVTDRSTVVSSENKYASFELDSSISYIPSGDYIIQESISEMTAVVKAYAGNQKSSVVIPDTPDDSDTSDDSDGSDDSDTSVVLPIAEYSHNITLDGITDPDGFFSLAGDTSTGKGTISYANLTLTKCLKVSSKAYIKFTAPADGSVTMVFNPSCAGYTLSVNGGNALPIPDDGIFIIEAEGGETYEIKKGKSESFLYYLSYTPIETPADDPVDDPTDAPVDNPTDGPTDNPADNPSDGSTDAPNDAPIDTPTDDPTDEPADEPTDNPTEEPDSPEKNPDTPNEEPEEELNFFERLWKMIVDFFKKLFGIKD